MGGLFLPLALPWIACGLMSASVKYHVCWLTVNPPLKKKTAWPSASSFLLAFSEWRAKNMSSNSWTTLTRPPQMTVWSSRRQKENPTTSTCNSVQYNYYEIEEPRDWLYLSVMSKIGPSFTQSARQLTPLKGCLTQRQMYIYFYLYLAFGDSRRFTHMYGSLLVNYKIHCMHRQY